MRSNPLSHRPVCRGASCATWFHSFAVGLLQALGIEARTSGIVPASTSLQSVTSDEVPDYLVALVELGPIARPAHIGGSEILFLETLTKTYLQARGRT